MEAIVRVAVGVLRDQAGRILIALRPSHKHQGDLWEFPGGKVEAGETTEDALSRELFEELGVTVRHSVPLISVPFSYPDKKVVLEVREVLAFEGEPRGAEGQPIRWVAKSELGSFKFPEANAPIVRAVRLPELICITGAYANLDDFRFRINRALTRGAEMILYRPAGDASLQSASIPIAEELCRQAGVPLVLNSMVGREFWHQADGIHLRSEELKHFKEWSGHGWVGASCHTLVEAERARTVGVDYLLVSPVLSTDSHPGAECLGWNKFAEMVSKLEFPVYALGGMHLTDLHEARTRGARGIAGISAFWN